MPKGVRIGGRAKGTPNRATADVRKMIALLAERNVPKLERWLTQTAEGIEKPVIHDGEVVVGVDGEPITFKANADPGKAADLLLRALEYHIPKLGRLEHTGKDGESVPVSFTMNLHPTGDGK